MTVAAPSRARPRAWTAAEDAVVSENYGAMSGRAIGEFLGRSPKSVCNRANTLRLSKAPPRPDVLPGPPLVVAINRWADRDERNRAYVTNQRVVREWSAPGALVTCLAADRWLCRIGLLWFDVWPDSHVAWAYFEGPEVIDAEG